MRHIMSFEHDGKPYQITETTTNQRVQLWSQWQGIWEIGHGKDVPLGSSVENVANLMRLFIQGELTHETYNQMVPGR